MSDSGTQYDRKVFAPDVATLIRATATPAFRL